VPSTLKLEATNCFYALFIGRKTNYTTSTRRNLSGNATNQGMDEKETVRTVTQRNAGAPRFHSPRARTVLTAEAVAHNEERDISPAESSRRQEHPAVLSTTVHTAPYTAAPAY